MGYRYINPETREDWELKAERWGFTIQVDDKDDAVALDRNGGVVGVWSESGEEWLQVGRCKAVNSRRRVV